MASCEPCNESKLRIAPPEFEEDFETRGMSKDDDVKCCPACDYLGEMGNEAKFPPFPQNMEESITLPGQYFDEMQQVMVKVHLSIERFEAGQERDAMVENLRNAFLLFQLAMFWFSDVIDGLKINIDQNECSVAKLTLGNLVKARERQMEWLSQQAKHARRAYTVAFKANYACKGMDMSKIC